MKSPTSRQQHVLYSDGRINVNEILTHSMNVTTINYSGSLWKQFNLVIDNVQLNHSGWYVCIEDNGLGPQTHSFKLQGLFSLVSCNVVVERHSQRHTSVETGTILFYKLIKMRQ